MIITLPLNYPLQTVSIEFSEGVKLSADFLKKSQLQIVATLNSSDSNLIDSILQWKQNVEKQFEGVEECAICYYVIHAASKQLPNMKCKECGHKFHNGCLYKWFESSGKSNCPLCRNVF